MDLVILVLALCLIGFVVWVLTTKIPMPPYWATAVQVLAVVVIALWVLTRLAAHVPNVLP